jgi:O-antigen/teichoic acid export membrane protein
MPRASMTDEPPARASRQLAKGFGTTMLARLGALVEVVAQPLYVLMFGLAGYGLYAVLWAAINLLANIFDLGMTTGLQRTVPQAGDPQAEAKALRAALLLGIGPCIIVAAVISLAADSLAPLVNVAGQDAALVAPAIALFAWALPLWAIVEVSTAALRAKQLFGPEIRLRILWEQLIRLALAVLFFFGGLSLIGLFVAHLVSLAITAVLCWRLLAQHFRMAEVLDRKGSNAFVGESLRAGLATLPHSVVARLFGDAPALVLNAMLPGAAGAVAGGLFVIIRKIASMVQLVRIAFVYVLAPVASLARRKDMAQVDEIYGFSTRLATAIVIPLAAAIAGCAEPLLRLFGPDATVATLALVAMLAARAVETVLGTALPILQVVATYRAQLLGSFAGLAVAIVAAPALVAFEPLLGMTLAIACGYLSAAILPIVQLQRSFGLSPFGDGFGRVLAVTMLVGTGGLLMMLMVVRIVPGPVALAMSMAIALAGIWLSCRLGLPLADRQNLGSVARRLRLT